jgi:hypothetical protein
VKYIRDTFSDDPKMVGSFLIGECLRSPNIVGLVASMIYLVVVTIARGFDDSTRWLLDSLSFLRQMSLKIRVVFLRQLATYTVSSWTSQSESVVLTVDNAIDWQLE